MNSNTPDTTADGPALNPGHELAEFGDLAPRLDDAFAGAGGAPPAVFLRRVSARRHRVVLTRMAAPAVFALALTGAFFAWRGAGTPVTPVGSRAEGPGLDAPALLVGSRGLGVDAADLGHDGGDAARTAAPRIRMGDGLESDVVRALLSA